MKRFLIPFFLLPIAFAQAQINIPNSDFETWSTNSLLQSQPVNWRTFNAIKDPAAFSGTSSLMLKNIKTNIFGTDSVVGAFADCNFYSEKFPAYMKVHVKYSLQPNETAYVQFGYRADSTTTAIMGVKKFRGTSNGYETVIIPAKSYSIFENPISDTVTILISSFEVYEGETKFLAEGSYIQLDSLGFMGELQPYTPTVTTGIGNTNFTNWTTNGDFSQPQNWNFLNTEGVIDSAHAGMTTDGYDDQQALVLKKPTLAYTLFKASEGMKTVRGFTKFSLGTSDTVIAYLAKYSANNGHFVPEEIIDSVVFEGNQSTYSPFAISLKNVSTEDTLGLILVYFTGETMNSRLEATPYFNIDNLSLSQFALGLENNGLEFSNISAFPNPSSTGVFTVNKNETPASNYFVTDLFGNKILSGSLNTNEIIVVDLSAFSKGTYFLHLNEENAHKSIKLIY